MSEPHGYQPGVPLLGRHRSRHAEAAVGFYTELFGWAAGTCCPPGSPGKYFMCKLRGRDVAAVGSEPPGVAPFIPGWNTYVSVESADDTAAKVTDAGGMVVTEPFDLLDVARVAVFADPAVVVFACGSRVSEKARS